MACSMNSNLDALVSVMDFMKADHQLLLFQVTSMLCVKQLTNEIYSIVHDYFYEIIVCALDPSQFIEWSKKGSCQMVERNFETI